MGIGKGDRVSLHLPTSPAFVIAFMGAMRAGAIAVPMNPLYVERELGVLFEQVTPAVSVTIDLLLPRLDRVRAGDAGQAGPLHRHRHPGLAAGPDQVALPAQGTARGPMESREAHRHDAEPLPALLARRPARSLRVSAATPTTPPCSSRPAAPPASPKCATLTHRNLVANAQQVAAWFPRVTDYGEVGVDPVPAAATSTSTA